MTVHLLFLFFAYCLCSEGLRAFVVGEGRRELQLQAEPERLSSWAIKRQPEGHHRRPAPARAAKASQARPPSVHASRQQGRAA